MPCQIIETSNRAARGVAAEPTPSAAVAAALAEALDDEYKAEALYEAVIARHGDLRPFTNIVKAEKRHAAAIARLMKAYGLAVPANGYRSGALPLPPLPDRIEEICAAAAAAEVENVRLFDEDLMPAVQDHPAIVEVFTALRDASRDRHLPAFRRCARPADAPPDLTDNFHGHGCGKGRAKGHCKGH